MCLLVTIWPDVKKSDNLVITIIVVTFVNIIRPYYGDIVNY